MINNITLAETLFSGIGISVIALGFLCILLKNRRRFGILTLLLGNLFLWSVIVFPKKISDLMVKFGVSHDYLSSDELYKGLVAGIFIFVLWYSVRTIFLGVLGSIFRSKAAGSQETERTDGSSQNEETADESSRPDPDAEKADPHLFDHLNAR
ncbi:MAG: hypothetical protein ACI4UM_08830 [Succinivibrio sp.]